MNTKSIVMLGLLVIASLVSSKADDINIKVTPRTNEFYVYYFPTSISTTGRNIRIKNGLTIFFEAKASKGNRFGDAFSFGGLDENKKWVSLNAFFNTKFLPNVNHQKMGVDYIDIDNLYYNGLSTNWQSYAITIRTNNLLNFKFPLNNVNASFSFVKTPTSVVNTNIQVRNIWVINESYSDVALSILNDKDKNLMELDRTITISWDSYNKFLQTSSDISNWKTIPVELSNSEFGFTMPFFQNNMFFKFKD